MQLFTRFGTQQITVRGVPGWQFYRRAGTSVCSRRDTFYTTHRVSFCTHRKTFTSPRIRGVGSPSLQSYRCYPRRKRFTFAFTSPVLIRYPLQRVTSLFGSAFVVHLHGPLHYPTSMRKTLGRVAEIDVIFFAKHPHFPFAFTLRIAKHYPL